MGGEFAKKHTVDICIDTAKLRNTWYSSSTCSMSSIQWIAAFWWCRKSTTSSPSSGTGPSGPAGRPCKHRQYESEGEVVVPHTSSLEANVVTGGSAYGVGKDIKLFPLSAHRGLLGRTATSVRLVYSLLSFHEH